MYKMICCAFMCMLLAHHASAQKGYTIVRAQLPMSSEAKDYYVKNINGNYVLNGDIIIGSEGQRTMMYQSNVTNGAYIWPRGYVAVKIDRSMRDNKTDYGASLYENSLAAIAEINKATNLRLVPYTDQKDYIRIKYTSDKGYGGVSPIGKKGGEQIIYITRESGIKTIIHELLHSLGFWHEQSRYDRDQYVEIDTNNVQEDLRHNFQIEPGTPTSAYDYESIMHYGAFAFAINDTKRTIKCKNSNGAYDCAFGNNSKYFSDKDIAGINTSYYFNQDIPKKDYAAELPYDDMQMAKIAVKPKAGDQPPVVTRVMDKPITSGVYMIKLRSSSKYLDVAGASNDNGAILQQWDKVGGDNQKFAVMPLGDALYLVKAMHSGKYLNVTGQSVESDATINQWDYVDQANLKFYIRYVSSTQTYTIQGLQSGQYWRIYNNTNGEKIVQAPRQIDHFIFERVGDIPPVNVVGDKIKTMAPTNRVKKIVQ